MGYFSKDELDSFLSTVEPSQFSDGVWENESNYYMGNNPPDELGLVYVCSLSDLLMEVEE